VARKKKKTGREDYSGRFGAGRRGKKKKKLVKGDRLGQPGAITRNGQPPSPITPKGEMSPTTQQVGRQARRTRTDRVHLRKHPFRIRGEQKIKDLRRET